MLLLSVCMLFQIIIITRGREAMGESQNHVKLKVAGNCTFIDKIHPLSLRRRQVTGFDYRSSHVINPKTI